jgi:hypothetical protein
MASSSLVFFRFSLVTSHERLLFHDTERSGVLFHHPCFG